ncbi:MAG: hypothetical protein ABIS18_09455 [Actinomycetota bacterium]
MNTATRIKAVLVVIVLLLSGGLSNFATADPLRKGKTTLVSTLPSGDIADGGYPSVSSDGRYVAFDSGARLTLDDTDSSKDVYRKDMITGDIQLVSVDSLGIPAGTCYRHPSMSGDGAKVAYLVGCLPGLVVLRDLSIGQTKWILSPSSAYASHGFRISKDGLWAVIDLDYDGDHSVGVIDVATGALITWAFDFVCGGCGIVEPSLSVSDNGRFVTYDSRTVGNDGMWRVYLHDRDFDGNGAYDEPGTGKTQTSLVGILPDGSSPETTKGVISGDGSTVAFLGFTLSNSSTKMYARDLATATTEVTQFRTTGSVPLEGKFRIALSGTGRYVAFSTFSSLLPTDISPSSDVYLWDRQLKKISLVSYRPDGNQGAEEGIYPSISSDGRYVAFEVSLPLDITRAVYRRDLAAGCDVICAEEAVPPLPVLPIRTSPYDTGIICAVASSVPSVTNAPPLRSGAQRTCASSGLASPAAATPALLGTLAIGGANYVNASPAFVGYAGAVTLSELQVTTGVPTKGPVTVTAHIKGVNTTVASASNNLSGCLILWSLSTSTEIARSCFTKNAIPDDLSVTATPSAPVSVIVRLDAGGAVGQASMQVSHISFQTG